MITGKQLVKKYRETIGQYTYKQRDCIGSIYAIIKAHGGQSDLVGSNWFARHEIRNLRPLTDRSQLYDGCAVLKTLLPGEPGYNLPERYKSDPDLTDYNHIGLGTDGGEILDSTRTADGRDGPGVSTAPIGSRSWDMMGDFEDVDYSDRGNSAEDINVPTTDQVVDANKMAVVLQPIRLRRSMDVSSTKNVIRQLGIGQQMAVLAVTRKGDEVWAHLEGMVSGVFRRGWACVEDGITRYIAMPETAFPGDLEQDVTESIPTDTTALKRELEAILDRATKIIKLLN